MFKRWYKYLLDNRPNYEITGAGVLHIRSSEIMKTKEFKKAMHGAKKIL